jgi:DNA-binding protein Fis
LETAEGNRAKAARLLGLEPAAFRKALRERFGNG